MVGGIEGEVAACLGQKGCGFMMSMLVDGRGNEDGRSVGRTFSIRVNIFELAKTEFFSVSYACFLALLHTHDPAVQCMPWIYIGSHTHAGKMESHSMALLSVTLAIDNYRQ